VEREDLEIDWEMEAEGNLTLNPSSPKKREDLEISWEMETEENLTLNPSSPKKREDLQIDWEMEADPKGIQLCITVGVTHGRMLSRCVAHGA
jgi:hypothetical protein